MEPQHINIVGGLGRMGSLFARFFTEAGYSVRVADASAGDIDWESVAASDVVVLSVPISAVEEVARRIGPLTRTDGAVIDISSLKVGPVRSMLQHCRGEVIGTHPLFGPGVTSLDGQLIFLCPARSNRWIHWLRSFFWDRDAGTVDIDPAEHDRLMATAQVLRHMLIFGFGRSLMKLGFDQVSELPLSGRWFRQLMQMLKNQLGENPALYCELSFPNQATKHVAETFLESARVVAEAYAKQDQTALEGLIREIAGYLDEG